MDCMDLQALSDSSQSEEEESLVEVEYEPEKNENEPNELAENAEQNGQKEAVEKEAFYDQYKQGLKCLMKGDYLEAESLFEIILSNPDLQSIETEIENCEQEPNESQKALVQLKYILLKNLASINSSKKQNNSKALEFLIQAAKIDSSDLCLWYEIGENALELDRFLIAKLAFEQSVNIDPTHWPSLDHLITLLYSLGCYSLCLKHIFSSLRMDKFYINGLILLKKIQMFNESFFSQQVENFIQSQYESCEIDLDEFLERSPEFYYDQLFERINEIKSKYQTRRMSWSQEICCSEKEIQIPANINTWEALGNFLIFIIEQERFNFQMPLKVTRQENTETAKSVNLEPGTKVDEIVEVESIVGQAQSKAAKRKKSEVPEDAWWKRRSLRRGIEKFDQNEPQRIVDVIRNFFGDSYLINPQTTSGNTKKLSISSMKDLNTMAKYSLRSLKEEEKSCVDSLLHSMIGQTSVLQMVKRFLFSLATRYHFIWPPALDELYAKLFDLMNMQFYIFDALSNEEDLEEFVSLYCIILTYLEIEFSKFKEAEEKLRKRGQKKEKSPAEKQRLHKLVFHLHEIDAYLERLLQMRQLSFAQIDSQLSKHFPIRTACVGLFVSICGLEDSVPADFFTVKILNQLEQLRTETVVNPNKTLREFLSQNRRTKILELNGQVSEMFEAGKFVEIVENLEDLVENHRLPLEEMSFNSLIYKQFLSSCYNSNQVEKCNYFCRKFLKQIVLYLNKLVNESEQEAKGESSQLHAAHLIHFISDILKLMQQTLELSRSSRSRGSEGSSSSAENSSSGSQSKENCSIRQESVWLMYQLVFIFYESTSSALKHWPLFKPIAPFIIIYENMSHLGQSERVKLMAIVHEYLARYNLCSRNDGEFLFWSIEILIDLVDECEICNREENSRQEENLNEAEVSLSLLDEDVDNKETTKSVKIKRQSSVPAANAKCLLCDECNDLLEQSFSCLFGYRKPRSARYLQTHVCTKTAYTLHNCINLYNYFKPAELPEYDSLSKFSIPSEFYEFLLEIEKLLRDEKEGEEETNEEADAFLKAFETEDFDSLDSVFNSFPKHNLKDFQDIYYLLADYNFKIEKDAVKKNKLLTKFYIRDLIENNERFDSWTALALSKSSAALEHFLENGLNIRSNEDLSTFLGSVFTSINLFRKALNLHSIDHIIYIEYGSFLYQIHSFCSRQIKLDKIMGHFADANIRDILLKKKTEFLQLALEAYLSAESGQSEAEGGEAKPEQENSEDWLRHYMLGKIKEKLEPFDLIQSLDHYRLLKKIEKASAFLEKHNAIYLKRLTYKTKGCLSVESNEVYYRIYALALKKIEALAMSEEAEPIKALFAFLEKTCESKFVKAHNDFQLEEISRFLIELVLKKSSKVYEVPHKNALLKCICICVAGLNQILKRFPQHYRSIYRLAFFYCKFIDLQNYEVTRCLLLSTHNWSSLVYMPCQGLFHERNKTNYFNGIWRISNNSNKDQDLERAGSFCQHLFQIVKLLIEVLEKSKDLANLIELSKSLYLKPDPEKKYLEDFEREFFAALSLYSAFKIISESLASKIKSDFADLTAFEAYKSDLQPIFLETYDIYKLALKHNEAMLKSIETLLSALYFQFNPDAITRGNISVDELLKFCQLLERKDKANKSRGMKASRAFLSATLPI